MRQVMSLRFVIALVLLGSCSLSRPSVALNISGTDVAGSSEGSYCQHGGCSGFCADGPAPVASPTAVHAAGPVKMTFTTGAEVTEIHVDIFEGGGISGQAPVETFELAGAQREHISSAMTTGRYYILVLIRWSRFVDSGDTSRAFLIDLATR